MPTWIGSLISGIPAAITGVFNWMIGRQTLNNSPEMQANAQAKQDQEDSDRITRDIQEAHKGNPVPLEKDEA